jgi:hypothetical protein
MLRPKSLELIAVTPDATIKLARHEAPGQSFVQALLDIPSLQIIQPDRHFIRIEKNRVVLSTNRLRLGCPIIFVYESERALRNPS